MMCILISISVGFTIAYSGASNATKIYSKNGKCVYKKVPGEQEIVIYETERDFIRVRGVVAHDHAVHHKTG